MNRTRIYVFLGTASSLVDMMASMDTVQLFNKGEYMVIFVDMMTYSPRYIKTKYTKTKFVRHKKEMMLHGISVVNINCSWFCFYIVL